MSFCDNELIMVTAEQKQGILKAALALHDEFGKVPKETEIEYTYHLARVFYKEDGSDVAAYRVVSWRHDGFSDYHTA
jgi:glucose-6-phosphate isomerase